MAIHQTQVLVVFLIAVTATMVLAAPSTLRPTLPTITDKPSSSITFLARLGASRRIRLFNYIAVQMRSSANKAMAAMLQRYTYISTSQLADPIVRFGLNMIKNGTNCVKMTRTDKFKFLHAQFAIFVGPLDIAYNYEKAQGAQTKDLGYTRKYVIRTVSDIKYMLSSSNQKISSGVHLSEATMNRMVRTYLTAFKSSTGVAPTDANIKSYRDYIILYTLIDVINDVRPCIPMN